MNITETDVKNWLNSQRTAHGLPDWAHLSVSASRSGVEFAIFGHTPDLIWLNAPASSIAEAVGKMQEATEPSAIIKRKREAAEKLLAEAAAMEAKS